MKNLLITSAMACFATGAFGATCAVVSPGQFNCNQANSAPIKLGDNEHAQVASSGSIVSKERKVSAVKMKGDKTRLLIDRGGRVELRAKKGQAVLGSGTNVTVENFGKITSRDRGIVMKGGAQLVVSNGVGAIIETRRQAVRAGTDSPRAFVTNRGTISSKKGRALQLRSFGAKVVNYGNLIGGEEVVEARGGFSLENYGTIRLNDPKIQDEDGVQFAGGSVRNYGLIEGSDDGVDLDEGTIFNAATGVIRSTGPDNGTGSGIDIDEVYKDGVNPKRLPGAVMVENEGRIEGARAIGTDDASVSSVHVNNRGKLIGRSGTAIRLAKGQGASTVKLSGQSTVVGDILFGNSDDKFVVENLTSDRLVDGIINGRGGFDIAEFVGYRLMDLSNIVHKENRLSFNFGSSGHFLSVSFLNFESWKIGGKSYTATALVAAVNETPAPVPLPAGLPLLILGLGSMAVLRRRR